MGGLDLAGDENEVMDESGLPVVVNDDHTRRKDKMIIEGESMMKLGLSFERISHLPCQNFAYKIWAVWLIPQCIRKHRMHPQNPSKSSSGSCMQNLQS